MQHTDFKHKPNRLVSKKLVHNVGINDSWYSVKYIEKGKTCRCPYFATWFNMLSRCYGTNKASSYSGCFVCEDWLTFSKFRSWMKKQDFTDRELDKDLLIPNNKEYSPSSCLFLPKEVNNFIVSPSSCKNKLPLGVSINKGLISANISAENKTRYLGSFASIELAVEAYTSAKKALCLSLANKQTDLKIKAALLRLTQTEKPTYNIPENKMIKITSILDLKGLIMNAYHSGEDPDAIEGGELKPLVNTAGYALSVFLSKFYDPILNICGSPLNMMACLDDGSKYREKIFPEYKANRAKIKKDEVEQEQIKLAINFVKQFLLSQGVTLVGSKGEEADDVVGYLCKNLEGSKTVHTVDKDLIQLVEERTFVFIDGVSVTDLVDKMVVNKEKVDLVVPPNLVILYKSLVGDKSDGYGGVKGFGPAAWVSLVEEFGIDGMEQLDALVANKDKTKIRAIAEVTNNKAYTKCSDEFDVWKTMYQVARIAPEIVDARWIRRVPETDRLHRVMEASNCTDLYEKYTKDCYSATLVTEDNLSQSLEKIGELLEDTPFVPWDYETYDYKNIKEYKDAASPRMYVDMLNSKIAGCSFAFGRNVNHVFYFSVEHADTSNVDKSVVLDMIKRIESKDTEMVAQNCLSGDTEVLTREGWVRIDEATDTQQIMQWDPVTEALSFVNPSEKIVSTSETLLEWGGLYHKGSYTPEHRVFHSTPDLPEWKAETALDVAQKHGNAVYIPLSGMYESNNLIVMNGLECRLMEAIRADGNFSGRGAYCRFHLKKQRKIDRLIDILDRLALHHIVREDKNGRAVTVCIYACEVTRSIRALLGSEKSYGPWVADLNIPCREAILCESGHWDGHLKKSSQVFYSVKDNDVQAFQLMAHLTGWRISGSWRDNNRPAFGLTNSKDIFVGTLKPSNKCKLGPRGEKPLEVLHNGKVYCFTVPSGAFMVRRQGAVFITGNCMFEGTITKVNLDHTLKYWNDTKLLAHHLDENGEVGLKALSRNYLNYSQTSYADTLSAVGATDMAGISGLDVLGYGADDAVVTGHLYQHFMHRTSLEGTRAFIHDYECPAVQVLVDAHIDGVTVDLKAVERMKAADEIVLKESMETIQGELSKHAKEPNFAAVDVLFEDQADYYKMKAQGLKDATKESVVESGKLRKLRMKEGCFYQDLEEVSDFKPWLPTTVGFNRVAKFLGLPVFDRVSRPGIEDWLDELTDAQKHMDFVKLIPPASSSFVKREGDAYKELLAHCTSVLSEHSPKKLVGTELNMDSPNQNQNLFYVLLGLPIRLRTKVKPDSLRGKYSMPGSPATDEAAVETAIANDCSEQPWKKDVLENLLKYKTASTRMKIYWNVYPKWVAGGNKADGVYSESRGFVHPGLNSCGTVTRRPTGSSPNLMQIAKGDVREMFIPQDTDHVICSIDFSSQELRLNADECQDPTWMSAYQGDTPKDLHALTGSRVVGTLIHKAGGKIDYPTEVDGSMKYDLFLTIYEDPKHPLYKVVKEARAIGKTVNFSSQFGAQKATLSRNLMCPEDEAQNYLDAYNKTFPMLAVWKAKVVAKAKIDGYVETAYGNRRHLPGINSRDRSVRSRWERQAINYTIQGCLQKGTLVQTREGYRPIEELVGQHVEVWTGFKWATAYGVNRGVSALAKITLEDGHVINCDVRHKLKGVDNQWLEFKDLKKGELVALPVKEEKLVEKQFDGVEVDWDFVLGFFCGDGGITARKNRASNESLRYTWSVCGGTTKKETILRIKEFLKTQGIEAFYREETKGRRQPLSVLNIYVKKEVLSLIETKGFSADNFDRKRVPVSVMRGTKNQAESFIRGYQLSDGCRKPLSKRLHTPNLGLLKDVQSLYDLLGLESNIGRSSTGHYLDLCTTEGKVFPLGKLLKDLGGFIPKCGSQDNTTVVDRRVCQGVVAKPKDKTARRIYRKYMPDKEIYSYSAIKSVELLDRSEATYTMSVSDELHQFVAEGVIHKNTAADILKVVLTGLSRTKLLEANNACLICPVYDELLMEIPKKNLYEVITGVSKLMSLTVPGGTIPMVPDTSFGPTWAQQYEVGVFPSQEKIDEVLKLLTSATT